MQAADKDAATQQVYQFGAEGPVLKIQNFGQRLEHAFTTLSAAAAWIPRRRRLMGCEREFLLI